MDDEERCRESAVSARSRGGHRGRPPACSFRGRARVRRSPLLAAGRPSCKRAALVLSWWSEHLPERARGFRSGRLGTATNRPRDAPAASGSSRRSGSRPRARDLIACVQRVSSTALLLGHQRSHAVGADCPLEDDRNRTVGATQVAAPTVVRRALGYATSLAMRQLNSELAAHPSAVR
jgi:hypothetical protein